MAGEAAATSFDLLPVVTLLGAGVIAVPIFKRLGLGSVLGYLAGGILIGPSVLGLVTDPQTVLHAAELGVVMFLFIIGLEMEPARLWSLRKQIFGLGVLQVIAAGAVLTGFGVIVGLPAPVAFVAGMGFVLTSTAIVMQILAERGQLNNERGQRIVSILLLEDLAIVPLLAIVAILAPTAAEVDPTPRWISIGLALGAIVALIAAGRWILNPVFRILADSKAREVMTAAALLVVLGAALVMQLNGLSMAMGAFLAGVLLSTSTFKHQLEADVEPFRGILLGIFFLAVGMSLDLTIAMANMGFIAILVAGYMILKAAAIYGIARLTKAANREATERAVMMAQGGEFAFVLWTTAVSQGLMGAETNAILTATVIISMVLTPFAVIGLRFLPKPQQSLEGVEEPDGLTGDVLVIGFGRFGQIASQPLIAKGHRLSIIDNDTEMVRVAGLFGMKVYYGDGTRLDILRAAGVATVDIVFIAVDKKDDANTIAELIRSEFPLVRIMARSFDRQHSIELVKLGVDYQIREVFESALTFSREALLMLGSDPEEADALITGTRERDRQRFEAQILGGLQAGQDLLLSNAREQAEEAGVVAEPTEPVMPDEQKTPAE
jgi:glutathione-regulated potassium-efflux system protein KefB